MSQYIKEIKGLTQGSILFTGQRSIMENNSKLFWDVTNNRLGICTSSPLSSLHVKGNQKIEDGDLNFNNTSSSARISLVSSGPGISISEIQLIGATSGWGQISYGMGGSSQKLTIYNNLTSNYVITLSPGDSIGIGTATPDNSSVLDIFSTSKGFLPPRMLQSQRISITPSAVGLMVYQLDGTEGLYIKKSTGWSFIG